MNNTNTLMVAILMGMGVVLVAGLVVIPAIQEAQARSATATERNKGQQGELSSGGKRVALGCSFLDPRGC